MQPTHTISLDQNVNFSNTFMVKKKKYILDPNLIVYK